jgi:hypothetical protein
MNTDQYDVFGGDKSVDEIQLERAIEIIEAAKYKVAKTRDDVKQLAIEHGFKVSDPPIVNEKVISLKDLRNYFYMRLWTKYPDRQLYHVEGNWQKDTGMCYVNRYNI